MTERSLSFRSNPRCAFVQASPGRTPSNSVHSILRGRLNRRTDEEAGWKACLKIGRAKQPTIVRDLAAPHKDLGRSRCFDALYAYLYRREKSAGFSISMPITAKNLLG